MFPAIGDTAIENIRRSDIVAMLDKVEDEAGPAAAMTVLSHVRRILGWHESRTDDFRSPITKSMSREAGAARERTLNDDEIRKVWLSEVPLWSPIARLLLLTACRRTELGEMRWDEVKDGVWIIPASRTKTNKDVALPLSRAAQQILNSIPTLDACPYVFTSDGMGPITGYSNGKRKLDAASGVSNWRLHDLRRTARTLLSRAGVDSDTAERCLGHAIGGVRGVYDRHQYQEQMRVAFERLAQQIQNIVDPPTGRVSATPRIVRRAGQPGAYDTRPALTTAQKEPAPWLPIEILRSHARYNGLPVAFSPPPPSASGAPSSCRWCADGRIQPHSRRLRAVRRVLPYRLDGRCRLRGISRVAPPPRGPK